MRQSDILSATEWSASTLSRELTDMEAAGIVAKISIGRANMITLVGEEPDWHMPPTSDTGGTSRMSDRGILLIEDNEQEARLLKRAFEDADVSTEIHTVRDGSDAVDFLLQRGSYSDVPTPRLVLLDLGLLVVDGIDVLRELDDRDVLSQFPVIVLSHSDDPEDIRQSYQAGATGYLTKPDDLDDLTDLVRAIDSFWLSDRFQPPRPVQTHATERGTPSSRR